MQFKVGDKVRMKEMTIYPEEAAAALRRDYVRPGEEMVVDRPSGTNWLIVRLPRYSGSWFMEIEAVEVGTPRVIRNLPSWF